MITRIVKLVFTAQGTADFLALFAEVGDKIVAFPGCQHLELVQGLEPQIFFTLSRWEDEAALEQYRHSDLFKATWAKTKIHFAARPEAWSTNSLFSSGKLS